MGGRFDVAAAVGTRISAVMRRALCALALAAAILAAILGTAPAGAQAPDTRPSLLPSWLWTAAPATARHAMVVAAHPLAAEAGLEILHAGGSAADAAIAVQLVLNVVEPQSSGIGGGAFALYWDAAAGQLKSYDARETAPGAAKADRFLVGKSPMPLGKAIFGGASVGVPGTVRLLETLHAQHGRLPWARLFEPAIRLADQGFPVSPRLHALLLWYGPESFSPAARDYFFDRGGSAPPIGHLLKSPQLAATLRAIAERGAAAFYEGPVAEAIVAAVRDAPNHQGDVTLADLSGYRVKEREPVCFEYRSNRICSMGPPSSGGLAVGQILKLIEPFDLGKAPSDAMNDKALHLIGEAQRLAFADRDRYVGDPDFVTVPPTLLDGEYLLGRRTLIDPEAAMVKASPGTPPRIGSLAPGVDDTVEQNGTTHFSVVDRDGSIISMTSTIESGFGSRVWAAGFLLNNELTDFALSPVDRAGRALANAVGPGKRPRSSMAPTIVFDAEGRPWAALGSPGGSQIILYVAKALVALIDWKLDAQAAASLMNFGSRGRAFEIEVDHASALWHALRLRPYGHRIHADYMASGAHIIVRRPDRLLEGGADPRREGVALGE